MEVQKAGCILLSLKKKKIGIIYRKKLEDYTFPKGHLEENETLEECALRETEEETGRICHIIKEVKLPELKYIDGIGQSSKLTFYLAMDVMQSKKVIDEKLRHELIWVKFNQVESILNYTPMINYWKKIKDVVYDFIK